MEAISKTPQYPDSKFTGLDWIRSAIFAVGLVAITIPYGVLLGAVGWLLPLAIRFKLVRQWRKLFIALERYVLGIKVRVVGREHIPDHACVVISNHQSAWETVGLQELFKPCVFVLKEELLRIPFFGWGLASIRMIAIDRSAGKEALKHVAQQGEDRLKQSISVVVFPEGTRAAPGEVLPYQIGGAFLASKCKATVVPIAHNAGLIWPRNSFVKKPGVVTVVIGEPIDASSMKPQVLNATVEEWIRREANKLV